MKKSRVIVFALSTALLSLALFFGTAMVAPEEACAGTCNEDWWTALAWEGRSTCQAAINACQSSANSEASYQCGLINKGVCQVGTFSHNTCYYQGGMWKVDCSLQYKCDGGEEFPD